jgi:hypothetical protein
MARPDDPAEVTAPLWLGIARVLLALILVGLLTAAMVLALGILYAVMVHSWTMAMRIMGL